MNSIILLFQLLGLCSLAVLAVPVEPAKKPENTLVLLHVLFRHGNRTPDKASLFPNDLHLNETYAPIGYSQLTTKGKRTEYEIGKYIRKQYGKFIPQQYTPDVVYTLTTNFKRTKMSLNLVLASLFPPVLSDKFEETLQWQPVPVNVEPGSGILTLPFLSCPSHLLAYYSYILSQPAQKVIADYQDLYDRLSKETGFDVMIPRDAGNIYFTFKSEDDYGLKLPEWASDLYPEVLEEAASVDYEFSTATSDLRKLSAGFLLKKIIEDSLSKQNGTLPAERKVFLYSAHEFNVATMLRTLNVFYRHVPPFGATIYFEIHNIRGEYGLKLFYQDYKQVNPRLLTIPGCSSFCPLSKLYDLVGESLPGPDDTCTYTTELN